VLWVLLRSTGDRWWLAEFMLFGPRWVCLLPAVLLAPAALLIRGRSVWVLSAALCIIVGPIMGLCVPWHRLMTTGKAGMHLRVMTCNTHSKATDRARLAALIDAARPDVVAMQEWEGDPAQSGLGTGPWFILGEGELRLQSRYPIRRLGQIFRNGTDGWGSGNAVAYELQTPSGNVDLLNLHLASPHDALSLAVHLKTDGPAEVEENTVRRLREAGELALAARQIGPGVILCGDFNMPCDSEGYRWNLAAFHDAFSCAGWGFGWTYHHSGTAARIDHVLTGTDWDCRRCWVAPPVGSPHRPLIADLTYTGS
jgi:endonuclease/exonuclease/phosphatase (EEP) superfamily protein YafD